MNKRIILLFLLMFSFVIIGCKNTKTEDIEITLDLNGGICSNIDSSATKLNDNTYLIKVEKGSEYLLPTASKEGYEFLGWNYNGTLYNRSISLEVSGKLVAEYKEINIEIITHTITYNLDGGKLVGDIKYEYTYPSVYLLPICQKDGFEFLGWYESPSFLTSVIKEIDETFDYDVVLYARFRDLNAKNPTITYELDGGYFLEGDDPKYEYVIGEEYRLLEPEKEDFYFDGWYETSNFSGRKITYITPNDTKDFVLYAKWESLYETRIIGYNLDGGHFRGVTAPDWYYEGKGCELPVPYKKGYDFIGWLDSSTNKIIYELNSRAYGNKVLVAQWEKIYTYSNIIYELNGGSIDEEVSIYPEEKGIELPIPKRSGYFFRGYYLESDFSGKPITKINEVQTGDITVYAKWVEAKLENAYISIYGDSISTFRGMIPEGYSFYYPSACESIPTYDLTWWGQLLDRTHATLLVNNSYSGTAVCGGTNQGNDLDRMKKLASDGINPDIIIIYLGINDVVNNRTLKTFEDSYVSMLNKMKDMFPSSFIFIATLPYETNTNSKYPGLRDAFSDIIRKVSNLCNVGLIDISNAINKENYLKTLNDTIHPNKRGMDEICNIMVDSLYSYFDNVNSYKISYDLDGGHFENVAIINEYSDVKVSTYLPIPVKEGYKFLGWSEENNNIIECLIPSDRRDLNLLAKWEKIEKKSNEIQVVFTNIKGEETVKNYQYGDKIGELNVSDNCVYLDGVNIIDSNTLVTNYLNVKEVPIYVYEVVKKAFGDGYLFDDLSLEKSYSTSQGKVNVAWISSDQLTITNSGLVNPGREKLEVLIRGEFQLLQDKFYYEFKVYVKPIIFRDLTNTTPVIAYMNANVSSLVVNDLVSDTLDIAIYSFSRVSSSFKVDNSELNYLDKVFRLRKSGIRVLLCLGAYASAAKNFSDCSSTSEGRKTLALSILETIEKYHFDGVDIDWEYPGYQTGRDTAIDRPNFTLLMEEISNTLKEANSDYIVSSAIPGGIYGYSRYELDKLNNCLDYINLMTYDLQNSSKVTHHANLYTSSYSPYGSVDQTVTLFNSLGVSKNKLVVGGAFYGRVYNLTEKLEDSEVLGSSKVSSGGGAITFTSIYNDYISKMFNPNTSVVRIWDDVAKAPVLYDRTKLVAISYDDSESMALKCQYVLENDLGGVMFWCYGEDLTYTLLSTIHDNIK